MAQSDYTFFWHDYETWGRDVRFARPAQFAGVRTNAALEEIEPPVMQFCQPLEERLPDPEACMLTGLWPQACRDRGLPESRFAQVVLTALGRPGTIGAGYNSIRFDDEVTRRLLWRNLLDPYGREWRNQCSRWDLIDLMRACHALRPEGIEWPRDESGRVSFRLEGLAAANGLVHESAHDALSDVRATLALARLVLARQPRLWAFALKLRDKGFVAEQFRVAQERGTPLIHVSSRFAAERGCMALVWPLAPHPTQRNVVLVWDVARDPLEFLDMRTEEVRARIFTRREDLPEGVERLPIKAVHYNRSPIVVAQLEVLTPAAGERWGIDLAASRRHVQTLQERAGEWSGRWQEVFTPFDGGAVDVEDDLYAGFVSDADRRLLDRLVAMDPAGLALKVRERAPDFADARLGELLWRFRAHHHSEHLDDEERALWREHIRRCLGEGGAGFDCLAHWRAKVSTLLEQAGETESSNQERHLRVLKELQAWGDELTARWAL